MTRKREVYDVAYRIELTEREYDLLYEIIVESYWGLRESKRIELDGIEDAIRNAEEIEVD